MDTLLLRLRLLLWDCEWKAEMLSFNEAERLMLRLRDFDIERSMLSERDLLSDRSYMDSLRDFDNERSKIDSLLLRLLDNETERLMLRL